MLKISHLSHSKVDPIFVENTLLKKGLGLCKQFSISDVERMMSVSSFHNVFLHMKDMIERKYPNRLIHFILGPISPTEDNPVVEDNMLHFLYACYYQIREEGRVVFPQFLYTPVISHIAESRICSGEDKSAVYDLILQDIYNPLFDFLYKEKRGVTGWFLEGFKYSTGASWEYSVFLEKSWNVYLFEDFGLGKKELFSKAQKQEQGYF